MCHTGEAGESSRVPVRISWGSPATCFETPLEKGSEGLGDESSGTFSVTCVNGAGRRTEGMVGCGRRAWANLHRRWNLSSYVSLWMNPYRQSMCTEAVARDFQHFTHSPLRHRSRSLTLDWPCCCQKNGFVIWPRRVLFFPSTTTVPVSRHQMDIAGGGGAAHGQRADRLP